MPSRTGAKATQDITLLRDAEFQILLWEFRYPPIPGMHEKTQSVRAHAGTKA